MYKTNFFGQQPQNSSCTEMLCLPLTSALPDNNTLNFTVHRTLDTTQPVVNTLQSIVKKCRLYDNVR